MTILKLSRADTTPGVEESIFSPPADWQGDEKQYLTWLRGEYQRIDRRQEFLLTAFLWRKEKGLVKCMGPWADAARKVIIALGEKT